MMGFGSTKGNRRGASSKPNEDALGSLWWPQSVILLMLSIALRGIALLIGATFGLRWPVERQMEGHSTSVTDKSTR